MVFSWRSIIRTQRRVTGVVTVAAAVLALSAATALAGQTTQHMAGGGSKSNTFQLSSSGNFSVYSTGGGTYYGFKYVSGTFYLQPCAEPNCSIQANTTGPLIRSLPSNTFVYAELVHGVGQNDTFYWPYP